MIFLDLVKNLRSRVGMQGTGPASVTSASTAEMDLVNSTVDAWIDIQNFREEWKWMRSSASFSTIASKNTYTLTDIFGPTNRLKKWLVDTAYVTSNSGQKTVLNYLPYDQFIYRNLNQTTPGRVSYFTVIPWDNKVMTDLPDGIYTIELDYQKTPQILANNVDVPELPISFHNLILYGAVQKYSVVIMSPEIYSQYSNQYDIMMGQLMRSQLPKKSIIVRGIV